MKSLSEITDAEKETMLSETAKKANEDQARQATDWNPEIKN